MKGVAIGGGASRVGQRYLSTSALVFPAGYTQPAIFLMHEGTQTMAFIDYTINHHWEAVLSCNNVLDDHYPLGQQSAAIIDLSDPREFRTGGNLFILNE